MIDTKFRHPRSYTLTVVNSDGSRKAVTVEAVTLSQAYLRAADHSDVNKVLRHRLDGNGGNINE